MTGPLIHQYPFNKALGRNPVRYSIASHRAAVASNYGQLWVYNRTQAELNALGSGLHAGPVVIRRVIFSTLGAAAEGALTLDQFIESGSDLTPSILDSREQASAPSRALARALTTTEPLNQPFLLWTVPANDYLDLWLEDCVLDSGWSCVVWSRTVNVAVSITIEFAAHRRTT